MNKLSICVYSGILLISIFSAKAEQRTIGRPIEGIVTPFETVVMEKEPEFKELISLIEKPDESELENRTIPIVMIVPEKSWVARVPYINKCMK